MSPGIGGAGGPASAPSAGARRPRPIPPRPNRLSSDAAGAEEAAGDAIARGGGRSAWWRAAAVVVVIVPGGEEEEREVGAGDRALWTEGERWELSKRRAEEMATARESRGEEGWEEVGLPRRSG